MKTAIYVRVSTEEQAKEGYSISAQKQKLKAFCISQGWEIEGLYVDEGISAKDMNRPDLKRMISDIKQDKIDCVLVYRLDRLTRSVLDLYKMLETFDKYDCKFKSATEVYDTTTAMGRMFVTIVAALAQWERENLGERIAFGYAEKARQGKYPRNEAPIGYDIDKDTYILKVNPKEAETVKEIYSLYRYYGMVQLARIMNENKKHTKEGNNWTNTTINLVLRNPVYIGKINWSGNIYDGLHEPIMSEEYWNETQKLIKARTSKPGRGISSNYIFGGKLKCPSCGKPMVGYYVDSNYKGNKTRYYQYRCRRKKEGTCSGTQSVSEQKLEIAFLEYLESENLDTQLDNVAVIAEQELHKKTESTIDREAIEKELEKIEKRKKKWQYAWIEELITVDDFKKRMQEANEEEQELLYQLEETEVIEEDEPINKEEIKEILKNIRLSWNALERIEKKSIIESTIEQIHYHHLVAGKSHLAIDGIDFKLS